MKKKQLFGQGDSIWEQKTGVGKIFEYSMFKLGYYRYYKCITCTMSGHIGNGCLISSSDLKK